MKLLFSLSALAFALFLACIKAGPIGLTTDQVNCFIRHLKDLNKLDETFVEEESKNAIECEKFVRERLLFVETRFREKYSVNIAGYEDCVMEEIKRHGWFEEAVLQNVYDASTHLTELEKKESIKKAHERAVVTLTEDVNYCKKNFEYGKNFDELFLSTNASVNAAEDEEEDHEDYCIKKYVVDNSLIDTSVYNITVNPKKLQVEVIDCQKPITELTDTMRSRFEQSLRNGGLSERKIECAMKEYQDGNFFGRVMSALVLGEIYITPEQLATERLKHIELMRKITNAAINCH